MKVSYRSMSNYQIMSEYLHCSVKFHGRDCSDTCLAQFNDKRYAFARLRLIFTSTVENRTWKVARGTLFKTLDKPKDTYIGMRLVREDTHGAFIDIDWIVRSVFLSTLYGHNRPRDYFVNDLLDANSQSDMFLRLHNTTDCI